MNSGAAMRHYITVAVLSGMMLAAADPPKKGVAGDEAKLQGGWYVHDEINDGHEFWNSSGSKPDLVLEAGKLSLYGNPIGHYVIDPKQKTIDFMLEVGFDAGKTLLGIYKLEDGTLTICNVESPAKRPTDFTSPPGAKRYLTVYRRQPKR